MDRHVNTSATAGVETNSRLLNGWRSCGQLMRQSLVGNVCHKYKVLAADEDDDDEDADTGAHKVVDVTQYTDQMDVHSKDYIEFTKSLSLWQSLEHLIRRRIDPEDDAYRQQFVKPDETGADRVRLMWSEHMSGEDNPEVRFIMSCTAWGGMVGWLYGGTVGQKTAVQDFMRRHNEYTFRGEFEGRRRIRDSMFLQFFSRGFRWGWRLAAFSGALSALTTTAIAYRNDVHFGDCAASGGLLCALWKAKLGLRAMAVSGTLGALFGVAFAGSVKAMLWAMHTSVPEYRHWRHTRYLGHLNVEKYSDGSTEYKWETESDKPSKLQYQRNE